ncbi:MAG: RNA-binding protein [Deltaproteobacteria bacterium]|nr:RNA-binding protein [Deltaproteobacteria bacterium]
MGKKLYVGNISFKATEGDVRELFSKAGEVEAVNLITDSHTGQLKGFGFVEMATEEGAKNAMETLNGTAFMDRTLSVAEAKPQEPREKRSFGGPKGGFGGKKGGFGGGSGGGGGYGGGRGSGSGRR